jgi:hypothetical protein
MSMYISLAAIPVNNAREFIYNIPANSEKILKLLRMCVGMRSQYCAHPLL